jgi:hypothetical protein
MGKRFEGLQPSFKDVLSGYQLLGLETLIGKACQNTAFGWPSSHDDDFIEFTTVPGNFSAEEIRALYRDAGLNVS